MPITDTRMSTLQKLIKQVATQQTMIESLAKGMMMVQKQVNILTEAMKPVQGPESTNVPDATRSIVDCKDLTSSNSATQASLTAESGS